MDNEQKKALAIVAGALGASAIIYRLCCKKKNALRSFIISGTATGSIKRDLNSPETAIWMDRMETAIEMATMAYQAWQNVQKRSS
jgi:hypothetical protein